MIAPLPFRRNSRGLEALRSGAYVRESPNDRRKDAVADDKDRRRVPEGPAFHQGAFPRQGPMGGGGDSSQAPSSSLETGYLRLRDRHHSQRRTALTSIDTAGGWKSGTRLPLRPRQAAAPAELLCWVRVASIRDN